MRRERIQKEIDELKRKQNAIILAHNYQIPEVQDIADFVGDSLDLAMKATKADVENIIFCGVDFMAESAKILNPDKNVIIPDIEAKCPMAGMVDAESLTWLKEDHPTAVTVSYINTPAEVKAISDICCTSSNGAKVIKNLPADRDVIFVPDQNLGLYIKRFIHDRKLILWPGICPTHHKIETKEILEIKNRHPKAEILVHPECKPEVIDIADHVFSTNGMVKHVLQSNKKEFIIGTEKGLCHRLQKEKPDKKFYPLKTAVCPNMKKINLEKVLKSLKSLEPKITLSQETIEKAKKPLQKMMQIGRGD
ncbi:MAG: quinolinate synthase [Thermoplasmata archaeon]|nr:MAG: quinolinate synthase [Thermoplasmata archaeon]